MCTGTKFTPDGAGEIIIATSKQDATACSSWKEPFATFYTLATFAYAAGVH